MANVQACRACGWQLRWAAEQNAWVCDRCLAVYPVQAATYSQPQQPYPQQVQQPYPQQGYGQQGYGQPTFGEPTPPIAQQQPAQPRAGGKSSKLWIVGTVVVVIGGIVALSLADRGGGKKSGDQHAGSGAAGIASPVAGKTPAPAADQPAGASGGGYTAMIAKMSGFRDRMCTCKDQACIDAVVNDMTTWSTSEANGAASMADYSEEKAKQLQAVMEAYTKCMTDAMTAAYGGTAAMTPPTPTPTAQETTTETTTAPTAKAPATSSGSHKASASSADAPCPGPGITRRCGGRCVNIQEDDNNCGGCGNKCADGKHCDGHLFCRDAEGNL